MKKFLTLLIIMATVSNMVAQSQQYSIDGFTYRLAADGHFSLTKIDYKHAQLIDCDIEVYNTAAAVSIPSRITINDIEYPVAVVCTNAFTWMNENQELKIPASVEILFADTWPEGIRKASFIESSIRCIGGHALRGWEISTDLNLSNIQTILWNAFYESNVEKIRLGPSIEVIGSSAFAFSSLKELTFDDGKQNSLSLSQSSFWAVKNIKELKIPKRQKLHLSDGFMSECDNLERVVIPDMDMIDCEAAACHDVAMLARPCGMLISGCEKLTEIVCLGSVPPELTGIDDTAKYDNHTGFWITDNMDQCILKVPAGSEQAYRNHPIWGKFKTILGFENGDYTSISSVPSADSNDAVPVYYNLQGIKVSNPAKGQLYIRTTGSKAEKVIF